MWGDLAGQSSLLWVLPGWTGGDRFGCDRGQGQVRSRARSTKDTRTHSRVAGLHRERRRPALFSSVRVPRSGMTVRSAHGTGARLAGEDRARLARASRVTLMRIVKDPRGRGVPPSLIIGGRTATVRQSLLAGPVAQDLS